MCCSSITFQKVKVAPRFKVFQGSDPIAFVISLNLKRRHLNESQRAMVAAKLANMQHGGDRKSNQAVNLPDDISQEKAAKLLNISDRSIRDAKFIMKEAPEEIDAIENREIKLSIIGFGLNRVEIFRVAETEYQETNSSFDYSSYLLHVLHLLFWLQPLLVGILPPSPSPKLLHGEHLFLHKQPGKGFLLDWDMKIKQ